MRLCMSETATHRQLAHAHRRNMLSATPHATHKEPINWVSGQKQCGTAVVSINTYVRVRMGRRIITIITGVSLYMCMYIMYVLLEDFL